MHKLKDLDGTNIARGQASRDGITLIICAPSGFAEGGHYFPAESLALNTVEGVAALYELCGQLIETHNELAQEA